MKSIKNNIYLKIGTIIIIALLLLIPTSMIKSLIRERDNTQKEAIREVSQKWGEEQTITGPFITIPYVRYKEQWSSKDSTYIMVEYPEFAHVLPDELKIGGEIMPERRYRGIYEVVVYNSKINLAGTFNDLSLKELDIPLEDVRFEKAQMAIGIDDLRGIEEQIKLEWNGDQVLFNPGVINHDVVQNGINALVKIDKENTSNYNFDLTLDLKGSQRIYFTPVGKSTDVNISSTWNNPSFSGAFLPDSREITNAGFAANWKVLHLNRNYPQLWKSAKHKIRNSRFGIDLLLPVDNYQKSYRSIKYAILFIGFTFLVFFFIEVLQKVYIHPIQYILVGIALVVFYTLLLSLSEHMKYNMAFITSALATLLLIAGYVKAILKSNKLTYMISGILLILYSFIFVIIQLQDLALLIGSVGIFIILGLVMYFSRQIDWYALKLGDKSKSNETDDTVEITTIE